MKNLVQIILLTLLVWINTGIQANTTEKSMNISLMVMDGWVRLTPPVAKNGAAYFTLHNMGSKTIKVVEVETTIAETAAMHTVEIDRSMVKMVHLEQLTIAAGEQVIFAPGGKHLMLINLTQKLEENKEVAISFMLENGESVVVKMPILKNAPGAKGDTKAHQHHH